MSRLRLSAIPWRRVAASAAGAGVTLGALVWVLSSDAMTAAVRRAFALSTGAVLRLLGNDIVVRGTDIVSNAFGISVVTSCTGLLVTGLYLAAVAAYPASWRARVLGACLGTAGLFVVNVVRLASLYYVGRYWREALDPIHQLVWQSLVIAIAVALWLVWAGRADVVRRRST